MKKGEEYEAVVERIDFPNKGIASIDDREITVKNALPGQKIRFRVSKKRSGKIEGRLLEVAERSALETEKADCPAFETCGSCLYSALSEKEELKIKEGQVRKLLASVCGIDPPWFESALASPVRTEYRNKMEFSFGDRIKGGELTLGMHCRGSFYDIVSARNCRIVDADFRAIVRSVEEFCREGGWPHYKKNHTGFLRNLLVRKSRASGEILVGLVTSTDEPENWSDEYFCGRLLKTALPEGKITGILHIKNDREADIIENQGTDVLYGKSRIEETVLGLRFKITPFSFFQTNTAGAETLYELIKKYVNEALKDERVSRGVIFDLYSGTGAIAQILAAEFEYVTAVEIALEAVKAAKENAEANGIKNCVFHCGDVLHAVDDLKEKPDVIVLDPPRDGIHPKALPKIISFGAKYIVYVSCKPTSLARDMAVFMDAGYTPVRGRCVDMFPMTSHVETVVLMSRVGV